MKSSFNFDPAAGRLDAALLWLPTPSPTLRSCRALFRPWLVLALAILAPRLAAQEVTRPRQGLPPAIEDNSFFIEEAYNQEEGVVQHISTFTRFGPLRRSDYGFTQEWPLGSQKHQLSVTLPYTYTWSAGDSPGLGDALLNYRYQLIGRDGWAALAPRLSLVLPTGSGGERRMPGAQLNLPASKRVNAWLVAHANAGATLLPGARTRAYNVGGSLIGLVTRKCNLLLEATFTLSSERGQAGRRSHERETIVSPGLRYAIDIRSLQIVPGIAVPFRRAQGRTSAGFLAYLSFEHPFSSRPAAARADAERPTEQEARE